MSHTAREFRIFARRNLELIDSTAPPTIDKINKRFWARHIGKKFKNQLQFRFWQLMSQPKDKRHQLVLWWRPSDFEIQDYAWKLFRWKRRIAGVTPWALQRKIDAKGYGWEVYSHEYHRRFGVWYPPRDGEKSQPLIKEVFGLA